MISKLRWGLSCVLSPGRDLLERFAKRSSSPVEKMSRPNVLVPEETRVIFQHPYPNDPKSDFDQSVMS